MFTVIDDETPTARGTVLGSRDALTIPSCKQRDGRKPYPP
jgi:hypothetical protein